VIEEFMNMLFQYSRFSISDLKLPVHKLLPDFVVYVLSYRFGENYFYLMLTPMNFKFLF